MKFNESSTSDSCLHEFWCIWRMHHMSKSACTLRKCGSVRSTRFICLSSSVQNQHLANFSVLLCLGFFLWINSLAVVRCATHKRFALISSRAFALSIRKPCHNFVQARLCPVFRLGTAHCFLNFQGWIAVYLSRYFAMFNFHDRHILRC